MGRYSNLERFGVPALPSQLYIVVVETQPALLLFGLTLSLRTHVSSSAFHLYIFPLSTPDCNEYNVHH